jgi:hypothetical protein
MGDAVRPPRFLIAIVYIPIVCKGQLLLSKGQPSTVTNEPRQAFAIVSLDERARMQGKASVYLG